MSQQVAVKLPDALLASIDELVERGVFGSRSAAVREGLATVIRVHRRRAVDLAYETAYTRLPEGESEMAEARRLAVQSINDEPWDKWW